MSNINYIIRTYLYIDICHVGRSFLRQMETNKETIPVSGYLHNVVSGRIIDLRVKDSMRFAKECISQLALVVN